MFEKTHQILPRSINDSQNLEHMAKALATEAFHLQAKAKQLRIASGDHISAAEHALIQKKENLALSLYQQAVETQNTFLQNMKNIEKMKPKIINGVICVIAAAEILSIPILLLNIFMMCRRHGHHHPTMAYQS